MVRDVCPLLHPHHASITASRWIVPVAARHRSVAAFAHGHTVALFSNRLLTWHRSFTRTADEPPPFDPPSFIYIHEWMPDVVPRVPHDNWRGFGFSQKQGVAFLKTDVDFTRDWSAQARRQLKIFQRSGAQLRLGTLEEFVSSSARSYLPEAVLHHTIDQATTVRAEHPEDLEVLVAADAGGEALGFFIAAYCAEVAQSYYVGGCYTAAGARVHAITGLVNWWFERSIARGLASVNFGDMCGPRAISVDPSVGYSNFKTHFGIHRVWRPQTLWKIRVRLFGLQETAELEGIEVY